MAEWRKELRWRQAAVAGGGLAFGPRSAELFYGDEQVGVVAPVQSSFWEPWRWWWSASGKGIPAHRVPADVPSREAAKAACEAYVRACLGLPAQTAAEP